MLLRHHGLEVPPHPGEHVWCKARRRSIGEVAGRCRAPEGDGHGQVVQVPEPVPPTVGQVEQVPSLECCVVANGAPKPGEGLEIRSPWRPDHGLAVARVRSREGVKPQIIDERKRDDLLPAPHLEEEVFSLVEMQGRLRVSHADEELVRVRQSPSTGRAHPDEELPAPRRELLGHLRMARERLLDVETVRPVLLQQLRSLCHEVCERLLRLLDGSLEVELSYVLLHVIIAELLARRPLDEQLGLLEETIDVVHLRPLG
mmetsp:Transcript_38053/g.86531  ORF Transcript_38053/g.86531 Transcript_38053/m.86531 type:complete len:258 (-) Transcript_38053:177-950(-)